MPDKEVMPLREQIARIICCFAKDNGTCSKCKENKSPNIFPDCFTDIREETDALLAVLKAKEKEWKEKTSKMFNPDYLGFLKGVEATKRLWEADKKEWAKKEKWLIDTNAAILNANKKEWARKEADWWNECIARNLPDNEAGFIKEADARISELDKIAEGK